MPILTETMLDVHQLYQANPGASYALVRQGMVLFHQQQTTVTDFAIDSAVCQVRDGGETHHVMVQAVSSSRAEYQCTCAKSKTGKLCPHIAAAAVAVRRYSETVAQDHWHYRLERGLATAPSPTSGRRATPYVLLLTLTDQRAATYRTASIGLHTVHPRHIAGLELDDGRASPEQLQACLDRAAAWRHHVTRAASSPDPDGCVNVPPAEVAILGAALQGHAYYYASQRVADYLPWVRRWRVPLYLGGQSGVPEQRLEVLGAPATVEAALSRREDSIRLEAGLRLADRFVTTVTDGSLVIVSHDPLWARVGQHLVQVANPEALPVMALAPLDIPLADEQLFRTAVIPRLVQRVPISGELVAWDDVRVPPVPRLYLTEADGMLYAAMRFGYDDRELVAERHPDPMLVEAVPGSWRFVRFHRDLDRETDWYQLLTSATYGLKRAGREHPYGTFTLRARTHPFDFLLHCIPALTEAGFEIYGEERLKLGRVNHATPTLSLGISSGIDWFDLEAVVRYGDQEVSLGQVRSALRRGERYIKLADGSIGQIPDAWLERYRRLFDLAEETADWHYRVAEFHLPLVDVLLNEAAQVATDADFEQRRQRLRQFDRITPQPVPAGFRGELRPYQKAGLDWLHFLHAYNLGGCLADDMGLGKTIQVLALLQSLREQDKADGPSLLVVPRSLLVNWQREAERFTPALTFLEYTGNAREEARSRFDEVDIVLTTYGVMRRDIEFLHDVHFDYVILDESQAIKNPISKTSKAARLLKASHRLVLTGTPVENNTFELWSQFAFLNPGLLGTIEYFKRSFAGPIEQQQDDEAATLLRQLIYPFILRRTKEQVAPELPPSTERVLYVDMKPSQRKLYQRTRSYYRRLLLGMIEEEGLSDARMKILEGLLRLRQASIHPTLLEPRFRGEAPKFELLLETLETLRAEGHKALIFSQFVEVLKLLRQRLDALRIRYAYLDGRTRDRQAEVDAFQQDADLSVFLISLKAGGVGLNLTAADYVIHLDPWWNPAVEQQASDRAHRIGQDKPVFVYRLITRDSVEEKILVLQERKRDLVEQLISSESSFFKSLTVDDVKALFG